MHIYKRLYLYIVKLLLWRIEDNRICKVPRKDVNEFKIYFYIKIDWTAFIIITQVNKSILQK